MKSLYKILFLLIAVGIVVSCSKLEDAITPAPKVGTHNDGNLDPASPNFHGLIVAENLDGWNSCRQCHASDLSGGTAIVGCTDNGCHPSINVHVEGIVDTMSQNFHGNFIRTNGWDILDCKKCHGENYSGGIASPTCTNCHTHPNGPESCNTCHGDFNEPNLISPPQDTKNNFGTDSPGVGAHKVHLYDNDIAAIIECSTCHIVPEKYSSEGHIGQTGRADVIFNNTAIINIASNAEYDFENINCSNTYCHGNFEYLKADAPENHKFAYAEGFDRISGNNKSIIWNKVDGTQAECGSCHGIPPLGHIESTLTGCGTCHSGIVDRNGNLVDSLKYKHIDGKIDLSF